MHILKNLYPFKGTEGYNYDLQIDGSTIRIVSGEEIFSEEEMEEVASKLSAYIENNNLSRFYDLAHIDTDLFKKMKEYIDKKVSQEKGINEGAPVTTRLDISIKDIRKAPKSVQNDFLTKKVEIQEKLDGTKLSIIRTDTPYDKDHPEKNWIVAYKNSIITPGEIEGISDEQVQKSSGFAQYKFVWDQLRLAHPNLSRVKRNTEFFCEFIMKKATLTRQYEKFKHTLYLIGYAKINSIRVSGLKVTTSVGPLENEDNEYYAKIFRFNLPPVLFRGTLDSYSNLISGCTSQAVASYFVRKQKELHFEHKDEIFDQICDILLSIDSELGGKTEGVVIKIGDDYYKILQSDQHDKATRLEIKKKYGALDRDAENLYWEKVKQQALKIINNIKAESPQQKIKEYSKIVYKTTEFDGQNENKTVQQKQDDLFTTGKILLSDMTSNMKNSVFIGKMRILTLAHYRIIENMIQESDNAAVCLVSGRNSEIPQITRLSMLRKCFPNITIIEVPTGNIQNIAKLLPWQITQLYCGTDRVNDYRPVAEKQHIKIIEIKRTDDDISATKVVQAIRDNDFEAFKSMTPKQVWGMFEELKGILGNK
jgi:hypothetical protein